MIWARKAFSVAIKRNVSTEKTFFLPGPRDDGNSYHMTKNGKILAWWSHDCHLAKVSSHILNVGYISTTRCTRIKVPDYFPWDNTVQPSIGFRFYRIVNFIFIFCFTQLSYGWKALRLTQTDKESLCGFFKLKEH